MSPTHRPPFVPVIPAGGAGTRLWPLSRRSRPKFLLDLTGSGRTLLEATLDRLVPLADRPPLIITGPAHRAAVEEQAAGRARVVVEPGPRNSMPAIALAAALIEQEDPDALIGSFAADHLIDDTGAFTRAVEQARAAAELGYLVTLGVEPTGPATGFGYIESADGERAAQADSPLPPLTGTGALPVVRFVEKPDRARAEQFLATGRFRWNAGIFVVGARVLLDALAKQVPEITAGVREIATAQEAGQSAMGEAAARIWPTLPAIAIDHALAEPLAAQGRVAVVPAPFDWDDVGDHAALARQLREHGAADDVVVLGGARVISHGSRATVHSSSARPLVLVGLSGITVVETDDALLVLDESRAQDLSALVAGLAEQELDHLR